MSGSPSVAVLLIGGGGHARSVADVLVRANRPIAAVVDPAPSPVLSHQDSPVWPGPAGVSVPLVASIDELGGLDRGRQHNGQAGLFTVAIGNNAVRQREFDACLAQGLDPATIIASTATVGGVVGAGSQVLEQAHVGPGATLGCNVIVNTAAVVEHDVQVGDHVHIAPGARLLAGVTVGTGTMIGAGAVVLPFVSVAAGCVVGAGSIVVKDVPAGCVVAGNPARPL